MVDISSFRTGYWSAEQAKQLLGTTRSQLEDLQRQLTTGKKTDNFSGLGVQLPQSLSLAAKIAGAQGTIDNINSATTRISLVNTALTQFATDVSDTANENVYNYTFDSSGTTTAQKLSAGHLADAIDLLNTNANGQYYFSGRSSDTKPVLDLDTILNGSGGKAGVKDLIAERKAADLGTGTGRLVISGVGTAVSISEESAGLPFGIKLNSAVTNGLTNVAATGPSSGTIGITFNGQPNAGDAITLKLSLPDGTTTDLTLTAAAAGSTPTAGQFAIGATPAATTANFQAALSSGIANVAQTTLSTASALKASTDFYAGSTSNPPARIAPPYASATGFLSPAQAAASTVIWYQGDDDTSVAARDTQALRVGDTQVVGIGARANEQAFQSALANWTVLSTETFDPNSATDQARYQALADRARQSFQGTAGTQKVTDIATEIALSNSTAKTALSNLKQKQSLLQTASDSIENADPTSVAVSINALQTRLQASYSITASLGQLSLVNFLK